MKNLMIILFVFLSVGVQAADSLIDNGDLIRISVYGNPDLTTEVKVNESGAINYPLVGEVKVGGLTSSKAEQRISQRLIGDGFLKRAQVNIIVLQSSSQQVSVLGRVAKPGKYSIETGAKTLFDFVAISGGVSASGSDVITVMRMSENPPKRISVNINKLFLSSDVNKINSANILMEAGDIIYVPEEPVFYVYGEARSPGVFRFKPGMFIAQAISNAGGVSSRGTLKGLKINRQNQAGFLEVLDAELSTVILADDVEIGRAHV